MSSIRCSRRALLRAALAAPGLAASAHAASGQTAQPGIATASGTHSRSIPALEAQYRQELFAEVLPFWARHGIDHERGGFICALDYDGTPIDEHKALWFQGRGIWVYSRLFNAFGRNPAWLEVASKTVQFVRAYMRQADGSWAQRVSRDGRIVDAPNADDTSGLLYMAEGLQEYATAARDAECFAMARALVLQAFESGRSSASPVRRQGLWFLTVLVCTQMLRRTADPALAEIARVAVDAIISHHYNPDTGLNDEVIRADLSRAPEEAGFTVFGHSIEALWMVMDEARRRRDHALMGICAERIRRHVDAGWDRVYGGLMHAVRVNAGDYAWPVERPVGTDLEFRFVGEYHYMKTFWSLAEVMVGALKVIEWRREPWAVDAFLQARSMLDRHLSMKPKGHPLYALFTGRRMEPPAHATRQENYHHPRAWMVAIQILGRMRAAGRETL